MTRIVKVRLQCDYELEIPSRMKMDEILEAIIDSFNCDHHLLDRGIELVNRTDDKLIRLRNNHEI
jgi:hypothetical protein